MINMSVVALRYARNCWPKCDMLTDDSVVLVWHGTTLALTAPEPYLKP